MASGPAPFASSKETTNYARLCRLLVDVGTQVLRDTFDTKHPPATLHKSLSAAHPTLQSLKKKVLNPTQWGKLYPTHPSSVSSTSFDITLLMVLLRNICSLAPPASTGSWDKLPPSHDNSIEANIARIKYYRNNVYSHASQASVDDAKFNVLWQEISNALLALGSGTTYVSAISRLKTECMDPDVEENYRVLLKEWKIDDDNTKEKLDNLEEFLKQWKTDEDSTMEEIKEISKHLRDRLSDIEDILKRHETDDDSSKDTLKETHEISKHLRDRLSDIEDILKRRETDDDSSKDTLKETHDILKRRETDDDSSKDTLKEIHEISKHLRDRLSDIEYILKRRETDDDSIKDILKETLEISKHLRDRLSDIEEKVKHAHLKSQGYSPNAKLGENEGRDAYGPVADVIDNIQQLYKIREGWLAPFPWCKEFRLHLDNIFTRLRMVSRKKERGVKTDFIVNMSEIFKPHDECSQPRKVLIQGKPGMGKTTYCNKVAYDWAKNCKAEDLFPDVQVLLLLKCRDINSDLWEAINDQLLPRDMKKEERDKFFTFIQDNQSKVLLLFDGLDELPTHKLPLYKEIIQGRWLSKCYLVVTARHEVGMKVQECCDTLIELEGFTKNDAEDFIRRYFETKKHLASKLLNKLRTDASLRGLTANPLNTTLLCLLCEDFEGDLPKGRTLLYHEIVQCLLRRYRRKKELPETNEDLTQLYHTELKHLGYIALNGLLNDEMYFDDSAFRNGNSNVIPELGFLSVQPGRSKRRPSRCYAFLHKSFQEFFAAFYLSCRLVDKEINPDNLATDTRYFEEFEQVLMFTCGILSQRCEAKATALMASLARQINQSIEEEKCGHYVHVALNCIMECEKEQGTFGKELARSLGSLLEIQHISCQEQIGESGAAILADAMATNSTATRLHLSGSKMGDLGAASLAKAVEINSTLTHLNLFNNEIGHSGAAALAKAMETNSTLTELTLSSNVIGHAGAAALDKTLESSSRVRELFCSGNTSDDSLKTALAELVETALQMAKLFLSADAAGGEVTALLSKCKEIDQMMRECFLSDNTLGDSGAALMAEVCEMIEELELLELGIDHPWAVVLAPTMECVSTMKELFLSGNRGGDTGAAALPEAREFFSKIPDLVSYLKAICDSGATPQTHLHLFKNAVRDSGAAALAKAIEINSTLTHLHLFNSAIGDSGAAELAKAVEINSTLRELDLSGNGIRDSGAAALAKAIEINSTLTKLDLSGNGIGDSGAAALAKAMEINSTLTKLDLSGNGIGDSDAAALLQAEERIVLFGPVKHI